MFLESSFIDQTLPLYSFWDLLLKNHRISKLKKNTRKKGVLKRLGISDYNLDPYGKLSNSYHLIHTKP